MRSSVVVLGAVSLIVAAGTGLLLSSYLEQAPQPQVTQAPVPPPKPRTIGVLVAATALEVGRTIDLATLEWQEWPEDAVRSNQGFGMAASEAERAEITKAFDGTVLRVSMVRGEPFTEEKVIRPGGGSVLALVLSPGMRSYTIQVDAINGAGGMAQPGDKVDIMLTGDLTDPGAGSIDPATGRVRPRVYTETILSDVKLISSDRRLNPATGTETPVAGNVTLEVTPEQAERLATATRMGRLQLVVRPLRSGPEPERISPVVTTDVAVAPALQASRRDIPVSKLDARENPFRVPIQDMPRVPSDVGTITIYRWTAPSTLIVQGGRVLAPGAAPGAAPAPGTSAGVPGLPDGSSPAPDAPAQPEATPDPARQAPVPTPASRATMGGGQPQNRN